MNQAKERDNDASDRLTNQSCRMATAGKYQPVPRSHKDFAANYVIVTLFRVGLQPDSLVHVCSMCSMVATGVGGSPMESCQCCKPESTAANGEIGRTVSSNQTRFQGTSSGGLNPRC